MKPTVRSIQAYASYTYAWIKRTINLIQAYDWLLYSYAWIQSTVFSVQGMMINLNLKATIFRTKFAEYFFAVL